MAKPAHKILGIEMRPDNMVRAIDPIGLVPRVVLDYTALSAGNQAKLTLQNKALRTLGQSARP